VGRPRRPRTPAQPLPPAAAPLEDEALIGRLIDGGVSSGRAVEIQQTIWRIRRLVNWNARKANWVSEREIRTFLIVPLLLALGWSEQRISIELEHAGIALWDRTFDQDDAQLGTVIETKKLWVGLYGAPVEQAKRYAARYDHCDRLVVSSGFRYTLLEPDRHRPVDGRRVGQPPQAPRPTPHRRNGRRRQRAVRLAPALSRSVRSANRL
jgi:hypothetical protein